MVTDLGEQSGILELWHFRLHELENSLNECSLLYLLIIQGSAM
jgi:hypothetical protein